MVRNYIILVKDTDENYVPEPNERVSLDSEGRVVICKPYLGDELMTCYYSDTLYAKEEREGTTINENQIN